MEEGTWKSWTELIDSSTIGTQSVSYASSAGNSDTVDGKHSDNFYSGYLQTPFYISKYVDHDANYGWHRAISVSLNPVSYGGMAIRGEIWFEPSDNKNTEIIKFPFCITFNVNGRTDNGPVIYLTRRCKDSYNFIKVIKISDYNYEVHLKASTYSRWQEATLVYQVQRSGIDQVFTNINPSDYNLGQAINEWTKDSASILTEDYSNYAVSAGNADSASSVAWSNVSGKPTTFTPSSHNHDGVYSPVGHTHSYLPLSGGTLTGKLNVYSTASDNTEYGSYLYNYVDSNSIRHVTLVMDPTNPVGVNSDYIQLAATSDGNSFLDVPAVGIFTLANTMYIKRSGNVGIGTNNPAYKLDVSGSLNATTLYQNGTQVSVNGHTHSYLSLTGGTLSGGIDMNGSLLIRGFESSGANGLFFRNGFTSGNRAYNASILAYNNTGGAYDGLSINGCNGISFSTGSDDRNEVMILTNQGKLGIGTHSPSEKLEVNGNIKATSFIKSGGTSSQFLKADGSVDSNSYSTTSHTHDDKYAVWKRINQRFDTNIPGGIYSVYNSASVSDVPGDVGLINIPTYSGHGEHYFFQTQIYFGTNDNTPKIRWVKKVSANSDPEASNWVSCWHSDNLVRLTNSEIDAIIV